MEVIAKKIDENQYVVTERYWLLSKNKYGALVTKNELDKIMEKCAERKVDCIVFSDEVCEYCHVSKRNNFWLVKLPMVLSYIFIIINYVVIQPLFFMTLRFIFHGTIVARMLGFAVHVIVTLCLPYVFAFFLDIVGKVNSLGLPRDVYINNSQLTLVIDSKMQEEGKRLVASERDVRRSKALAIQVIAVGVGACLAKSFILYIFLLISTGFITDFGIKTLLYKAMIKRQVGTQIDLENTVVMK